MKQVSLLLSCMTTVLAAIAQPTLQQTNGFQLNTLIQLFVDDNPTVDEGNGGVNQIWDFSSLMSGNGSVEFSGMLASVTPFAADFPNAEYASSNFDYAGNTIYNYFTNDDAHYSTWGYESDQLQLIYSNPREILHYPFTYGDVFSDYYYGLIPSGYNSGTIQEKADGYGTLILPTGTFYNCLRVREVRKDTFDNDLILTATNDTSYKFYVVNYPEPLCQVNHHHTSNGFDLDEIYWQDVQPNGISQMNSLKTLSVFPNPCHDILNINIDCSRNEAVLTITDALGKVVETEYQFQNQSIILNTAMLPEGIYFISIADKKERASCSFVKEAE